MIPPFEPSGYLPPGIHPATLAEIAERFAGSSEVRRVQMESIRWMVDLALRAGIKRIVLNGSFTTDIMEPNDVDCELLTGPGFPLDLAAEKELLDGLPYLAVDIVGQSDFDLMVNTFFANDRSGVPKGMIEVVP